MGMSKIEQAVTELQSEVRTILYVNAKRIKEYYDLIGEPDQLTIINQLSRGGEAGTRYSTEPDGEVDNERPEYVRLDSCRGTSLGFDSSLEMGY